MTHDEVAQVVLDVYRHKHAWGQRVGVVLAKLRASWTNRPFTNLTATDMRLTLDTTGWRMSSVAVKRIRGKLLQVECVERGFCARPNGTLTMFSPILEPWPAEGPVDDLVGPLSEAA